MGRETMLGSIPGNTLGVLGDIVTKVSKGVYSHHELDRFSKRENPFMTTSDILGEWHEMYWKIFRIDPCLDRITMPEPRSGFGWALPRVPEIPTNLLVEAWKERWNFSSTLGDDLEAAVPTNERHYSRGPYGIWVRDRREADEELKNFSAEDIEERGLATMTLDERFALGLFFATRVSLGLHLDVRVVSLCSGSRDRNGNVPVVRWYSVDTVLGMHDCDEQTAHPDIRAREVVS